MALPNEAVLSLARDALRAAEREVPRFSHPRSPRTYTQHQLFALLAVRRYLRVDYRAMTTLASQWPELRTVIGLNRAPHYSTLCYAERRLFTEGGHGPLLTQLLERAHNASGAAPPVEFDRLVVDTAPFRPRAAEIPVAVPVGVRAHISAAPPARFPAAFARSPEAPAARPVMSFGTPPANGSAAAPSNESPRPGTGPGGVLPEC